MRQCISVIAAILLALTLPRPASAITVFDAANFAQNVLTAARALLMVDSLIDQLVQQVRLVEGMDRNLTPLNHSALADLRDGRDRLEDLLGRAQGVPWDADTAVDRHEDLFPGVASASITRAERLRAELKRAEAAREGWRHDLEVQSGIVEGIALSEDLLEGLLRESEATNGVLGARQAGNQILALSVREQFHLQALIAAQGRSTALEGARIEAASRAAKDRFADSIGNGDLYNPEP